VHQGPQKGALLVLQHIAVGVLLSPLVIWLTLGIAFLLRQGIEDQALIVSGAFFLLGVIAWILLSLALPLPVRLYVFGHELTHVLFASLFRIKSDHFRISAEGGSVRLHGNNLLISLAPYVSPIYLLLLILSWEVGRTFAPIDYLHSVALSLAGMAFGFHVTFTVLCLSQFQPDLTHYGRFLSWVFILTGNLFLIQMILLWVGNEALSVQDWMGAQVRAIQFVMHWTAQMWEYFGFG
jgi:hypothetical protein